MKKLLILTVISLIGLTSCKKNLETPEEKSSVQAKSFKEIKTNDQFSYNTSNEITLNVSPMITPNRIVNTLRVSSTDGKTIYISRLASMDEALTEKFIIPSTEKSLTVSFGSIRKTFNTTATLIEFDYLNDNLTEE
jgi:hypothetical protein